MEKVGFEPYENENKGNYHKKARMYLQPHDGVP